jgi:predicted NUDIX family phosphoesterase
VVEQVWGVRRELLFGVIESFHGFRSTDRTLGAVGEELEPMGEFRPRHEAEEDPSFQQIIPYVEVRSAGRILLLERLPSQGEPRLHHCLSVGIGGHVNPEAPGSEPLLTRALRREVTEELEIDDCPEATLLGFINDDETAVGSVHFGIACTLEVSRPVEIRERDKMVGRWVSPGELPPLVERMESWSRFLVEARFS